MRRTIIYEDLKSGVCFRVVPIETDESGLVAHDVSAHHLGSAALSASGNNDVIQAVPPQGFIVATPFAATDEKFADPVFIRPNEHIFSVRQGVEIAGRFIAPRAHIFHIDAIFSRQHGRGIAQGERRCKKRQASEKNNEGSYENRRRHGFDGKFLADDYQRMSESDAGNDSGERENDDLIANDCSHVIDRRSKIVQEDEESEIKRGAQGDRFRKISFEKEKRRDDEKEKHDRSDAEKERIEIREVSAHEIASAPNRFGRGEEFHKMVGCHTEPGIEKGEKNRCEEDAADNESERMLQFLEETRNGAGETRAVQPLIDENENNEYQKQGSDFFKGLAPECRGEESGRFDPHGRKEAVKGDERRKGK